MIKGFLSCAAYYTLYCIAYWPIQVKKNEVKHPKSIKFEAPHEKGRGRRSWTGVKFQRGGVWNFYLGLNSMKLVQFFLGMK